MTTHNGRLPMLDKILLARALSIAAIAAGCVVAISVPVTGSRPSIAAVADWSGAEVVAVIMTEYRFSPSELSFRRGVPYRLHLENHGAELHEFTAPAFFHAVEVGNPEILIQEGREVVLQPGEHADVYLIPRQAGRYRLTCADHDYYGMVGEITIE